MLVNCHYLEYNINLRGNNIFSIICRIVEEGINIYISYIFGRIDSYDEE